MDLENLALVESINLLKSSGFGIRISFPSLQRLLMCVLDVIKYSLPHILSCAGVTTNCPDAIRVSLVRNHRVQFHIFQPEAQAKFRLSYPNSNKYLLLISFLNNILYHISRECMNRA